MKLRSLSLRGVTRFQGPEPVTVDCDDLGPGLVALVGPNGAGKTSVMESVAACLYKRFPSRPGWYESFSGRDAFLECVFGDHGHTIQVRVQVDAEKRQTESYVFEDGVSLTTGRAAEFDQVVAARFGSEELFLASVFAAQNKAGNFLLMPKAARKRLFVELLGLGHLDVLSMAARERRTQSDQDLRATRAAAEALRQELAPLEELTLQLGDWQVESDRLAGAVATARTEETAAVAALERARAAGDQLKALQNAVDLARRGADSARQRLADVERERQETEARAAARVLALESKNWSLHETAAERRKLDRMSDLAVQRGQLTTLLGKEEVVRQAAEALPALRDEQSKLIARHAEHLACLGEVKQADLRLSNARQQLDSAREALAREVRDLDTQTALLSSVPCTDSPKWRAGLHEGVFVDLSTMCPLLANARQAKTRKAELEAAPTLPPLELAVREAEAALTVCQANAQTTREGTDDRMDRLRFLEAEIPRRATLSAGLAGFEAARVKLAALDQQEADALARYQDDLDAVALAKDQAQVEAGEVRFQLARDLDALGARVLQAAGESDAAQARHEQAVEILRDAIAESDAGAVERAENVSRETQRARLNAEAELRRVEKTRADVSARVDLLRARQAELPALEDQVRHLETLVGDWLLLETALGKDGVQALEIDAAGPEVARLTNELLTATYGPRFSISFETLREKKSKAGKFSEVFDVKVFDGSAERPVEALSGGEKVVVGEAVGLAISIFNARKSGVRWRTIFRDETAGALDPENATRYVAMLRRALELGGFEQCVFIAHLPAVYESADVQLYVTDGRVSALRSLAA